MPNTIAPHRLGVCSTCGRHVTTADDLQIRIEGKWGNAVRVYMHDTYEGCRKALDRIIDPHDEKAWLGGWLF